MKSPDLRYKAAAATLAAVTVLAGCTHSSSSSGGTSSKGGSAASGFGNLPAAKGTPTDGGVVRLAQSPGAGPNYIFPITPAAQGSVYNLYQFQYLLFRPLYASPVGSQPKINTTESLAAAPVFSDANKTVTIKMKDSYTWSDGQKVTAKDVVFDLQLLKAAVKESAANFGNYTPGYFPDSISKAVATDPRR